MKNIKTIKNRRIYGEHLTPIKIFKDFILPMIKDKIREYRWVDLFAGEGNLILPILDLIPKNERIEFFKEHIFLFDVQEIMIKKAIQHSINYGIPEEIAKQNILHKDTIKEYPKFILDSDLPVYHITNPPYLYIGYIVKKQKDGGQCAENLEYFKNENEGYQDLYQLCLMNDLRNKLDKMIYIIPSNFLFGLSSSNKIRDDFLKHYNIEKVIIFEKDIFEHTGVNVVICFFDKKEIIKNEILSFEGIKFRNEKNGGKETKQKIYTLNPKNHYRAGNEIADFVDEYKALKPLKINYYLTLEEIEENKGKYVINTIDANDFNGKEYEKKTIYTNEQYYAKITNNILFVRTVDTGSMRGRAGLYVIKEVFNIDGILVTKAKYRTHPIQIFIEPQITLEEQILLKEYFNLILEYFRELTDSEFLTTYKYSNSSEYTRKYLGLLQVRKIMQTFPILTLDDSEKEQFKNLIDNKNIDNLIVFLTK